MDGPKRARNKRSAVSGQRREPAQAPAASQDRRVERRDAIQTAALEEFSTRGFAAARLDDVASRAGVAKGTIYLYFQDKEALFQELLRSMLSPLVKAIEAAPISDVPARVVAETLVDFFIREVYGTRRGEVIRLILTEGPRFPQLAEFYYREVISRVLPVMRALFARAVERGELSNDALARFPQLLVAPALMALMWNALFARFSPLDVKALMRAHLDLLFGKEDST